MATAKKRGAPASTQRERQKKLTRKEKSVINKARLREVNANVLQTVRDYRAALTEGWPRKAIAARSLYYRRMQRDVPATKYTKELDQVLFQLLSGGASLDTISALEGMPDLWELLGWMADANHTFSKTFLRAREQVVPLYEDRAMSLALDALPGVIKTRRQALDKFGGVVDLEEERTSDAVERAKLGLIAYQWALGWMLPKKHGKQADPEAGKPNAQLTALFDSLKSGPKE